MIESSKKSRIISGDENDKDKGIFQNILRPNSLRDYIGQEHIKKHLEVLINSAKIREESLEHILFYGPPGLGKTTLGNIISKEMGTNLRTSSGPAIEKQSDLVSILSNLEKGDVLFIDEIHRLKPHLEEILYTAMEDYHIDIIVGSGTGTQSIKLPIKPFTLVGATTKLSSLSSPLRDRFGNIFKLDFYKNDEIEKIIKNNSIVLGLNLEKNIIETISKKSRGTPRIANRLLKIVRDYYTIGENISDLKGIYEIFISIGIDELGLDYLDRKYLESIFNKFSGGPVGLNTISATIGEEEETIEDVVEPYLLQIGFIERTSRGRKITKIAEDYLINK